MDWPSDPAEGKQPLKLTTPPKRSIKNEQPIIVLLFGVFAGLLILFINSARPAPPVSTPVVVVPNVVCPMPNGTLLDLSGVMNPKQRLPLEFTPSSPECLPQYISWLQKTLAESKMLAVCLYHYGILHDICVTRQESFPVLVDLRVLSAQGKKSAMKETTTLFPHMPKVSIRRYDDVTISYLDAQGRTQATRITDRIYAHVLAQFDDLVHKKQTIYYES